jgi:HTH-type transcriptional regulator, competence development regulator
MEQKKTRMDSNDPIHEYILKANSEDFKEMLDAAGLDLKTEAAWVEKIVRKHIDKPAAAAKSETPSAATNLTFGAFLRMLRQQRKMEINDLAQKAKIEAEEIVKIENDATYRPRPRTVSKLAELFKIPVDRMSMLAGHISEIPNELREQSVRFMANAKHVAGLPKEEAKLLREFVSILCGKK